MPAKQNSGGVAFWLVLAGIVLLAFLYFRGDGGSYPSFARRSLPPLNSAGTWLNADQQLGWDALTGDLVWLEFSFLH